MQLFIEIPGEDYNWIKQAPKGITHYPYTLNVYEAIRNGTLLPKETTTLIPYLMHKEMGIPISECQEAYDLAIEYLQSKSTAKG